MSYFKFLPKLLYSQSNSIPNYKLVANIIAKSKFISDAVNNSSFYYLYDVVDGETPEDVAYRFYQDPTKHWIVLLANEILDPQFDWTLSVNNFEKYINAKYSSQTIYLDTTETYLSDYVIDEIVYQGSTYDQSSVEATVVDYDSSNKILQVKFPSQVIANSVSIVGLSSNLSHTIVKIVSNNDGLNWAQNTMSHYQATETTYNNYYNTTVINKYKVSANDYQQNTDTVISRDMTSSTKQYSLPDGTIVVNKKIEQKSYYDYELELNDNKRQIKIIRPEFISLIEQEFMKLMGS